eukprot:4035277-Pleurochrysis_carterae.AAC.4
MVKIFKLVTSVIQTSRLIVQSSATLGRHLPRTHVISIDIDYAILIIAYNRQTIVNTDSQRLTTILEKTLQISMRGVNDLMKRSRASRRCGAPDLNMQDVSKRDLRKNIKSFGASNRCAL